MKPNRYKIIRRCGMNHEICSICDMCKPHCVGHVGMRLLAEPVYAPPFGVRSQDQCAALIAIDTKSDTTSQVGRVDTAVTREVEEDQSKGKRSRKVKVAA